MTEKLYYEDAYISEFSATVVGCERCGDKYEVVLDKTAFFPEEGGQYSDTGRIGNIPTKGVKEREGVIYHLTDLPIAVGERVDCVLDFDERYEKMQCHTGEHILSGIFHKLYGLDNVGFHLGADEVTMDLNGVLTREELDRVEELANEVIYKNVAVTTSFPSPKELPTLEYRSKLELSEGVRLVSIGEYDVCACCAPHVAYTGEIGLIKILDFAKLRGGIRIFISAGRRAMRIFREFYKNAQAVSGQLSVPKSEISEGVKRLSLELADLKAEYKAYRLSQIQKQARELSELSGNTVLHLDGAEIVEMIEFSNIALPKCSGILVLISGVEGDYKYVISSNTCNLTEAAKEINKSLLGRGGGRPNMLQGSFKCTLEAILKYFNP